MSDTSDTFERLRTIVARETGLDRAHVTRGMLFSDAIQLARALQIRRACEVEFRIRFADENAHVCWTTVADIERWIDGARDTQPLRRFA